MPRPRPRRESRAMGELRRSLLVRWTVRYTAATLLILVVVGAAVYHRSERLAERDAEVLLELQVDRLGQLLALPDDALRARVRELQHAADPDLKLSLQIFDASGRLRFADGHPLAVGLPLPEEVRAGEDSDGFQEVKAGAAYPYWAFAKRFEGRGAVQASLYARSFIRRARRLRDLLLAMLPVAALLAGGLGIAVSRASLRPVSRMLAALQGIGIRDLHRRVPRSGSGDELDRIAASVNGLLTRLEASVESLRRFTGHAAHQLRTPLTALRSRIEVALATGRDPETKLALEGILSELDGMSSLVDQMLALTRFSAGLDRRQLADVELGSVAAEVVEFFAPLAEQRGLSLELARGPELHVRGDASWIRQALVNLLDNAVGHTPPGGAVRVAVERGPDGESGRIRVCDTGPGIDPRDLEHVFERFYRAADAPPRAGAGLGLAIAREIAEVHGGTITAESRPGAGATFEVELPLRRPGEPGGIEGTTS